MVSRILEMRTPQEFLEVSCDLMKENARAELYNSLVAENIVLLSEDRLTKEQLEQMMFKSANFEKILSDSAGEEKSARLLHRLQILGYCNPGIERFISQYLERACV